MEIRRDEYIAELEKFRGNGRIKIITGLRRCGKSYLLFRLFKNHLLEEGVKEASILELSLENLENARYRNPFALLDYFRSRMEDIHGQCYIFIDEIQLIEKWEKTVNSYSQDYTTEYEVFISGSNSKMLSGELATLLSGRYIEFNIYPFSYTEYTELTQSEQGKESYLNYMNTGGLPELFSLPDKQEIRRNYMSSMKDSILLKDIIQRYKIRDPKLLDDIFSFLVNNASNLISVNSIVNWFKGKKRNTSYDAVASYIGYIEEAFLIHRCNRYDIKGKEVLEGTAKFYMNDLSYKNFLYTGFAYGIGYKLENQIYLELKRKGYDVYTGCQTGKEIDFVAQMNDRRIYLQSTFSLTDEQTARREYAAMETIRDNYEKAVVSLDDFTLPSNNGILHFRAWELYNLL